MVELAGLEERALEEIDELRGLSQGAVCCLRWEAGLMDEVDDATWRPGDEDQ